MKSQKSYIFHVTLCLITFLATTPSFASQADCEYHNVKRVIDGDTFVLDNGERVRLIGIDTPETVDSRVDVEWFGREASVKLKSLIDGKRVCLKRDRTSNKDKYNRLLRYVWVDDIFINKELILQGYAFAYIEYPFQYLEDFRRRQRIARQKGLGLWNKEKQLKWQRAKRKNLALLKTCGKEGTICPWNARDFIGQQKIVRFFVRKAYDAGDRVFLNSERDYKLERNFTIMILESSETEGIDIADMFWGKTVDVTGKIKLYKGRAEIIVKNLSKIRIVQPF